ncbi:bifunctional [glutamine synthetase] adenylyltransferase/[glutamine synthetase]-adenylyl-L-tyrosine phosphorylase [Catellatospora tritici]|uniref:bifunctional [glutamine synthetase] adenylyltransferase/[glutamine synthetase]-adenylyl-L-tyrosine phosphorylase n=1 Tax=Catellatospora tritici TaxID=2851566 RepID=UPI001C2CE5A2|nr:bifunctional [glutamine synthetase] adenylyltransferase/[glutamine synthetase]-adenylyl-L-tyrosine phosphorylase [Catellatospora tritici]
MAGIGRLARFGFTLAATGPDPVVLLRGLRLWDPDAQRPVDEESALILEQLGRAADPDLALRQLHRICERDAGVLERLGADEDLRIRLLTVLGASSALGDQVAAQAGQWQVLTHTVPPRYEVHSGLADVPALRQGYQRGLLRIAAADLADGVDVETTMAEITALADATLRAAYRIALGRVSTRPRLAVIAMGKCGGDELNYVSDVDVIFVAAEDEDLSAATTVAAALMEICGHVAWPVDAALRPEGGRGPLVRTLASHLVYYKRWARTWEFQALLKARPVAGDSGLGKAWLAALQPLVWHAAERPEAVEDVRAMRRRIIDQVPRNEIEREIKRGPGGLRDIEFAVQLLQLVHGRGDESLRSGNSLRALRALVAGGYVGRGDGEALSKAYRFLRNVEHRLQLQRLRRTHTVPADDGGAGTAALRWLARAMNYKREEPALGVGRTREGAGLDPVAAFRADWVTHAAEVRRLHAKLLYRPLLAAVARVPADGLSLRAEGARRRLELLGYADPAGALRHLEALTAGVSRTAAIQRTLLPVLLAEFADAPNPDAGLLAYRQVSDTLGSTPWYLRLLRDEGPVALRLARVLDSSRYLTDLLTRDPEALRLLADDTELALRVRESLCDGLAAAAARHADPRSAVAAVRAMRRRELFRIGCADLLSGAGELAPARPVDVLDVGQGLADLTDATLGAALAVARQAAGAPPEFRFTIVGMGRLGGAELSYPSDADVLFVYEPAPGMRDDEANGVALAIAEQLRTLLSAPAPDPPLGVDADLRPEGRQGPLVRSLAAYQRYYATWSQIWEAQALLRARPVAGDADLAHRFTALVDPIRYPVDGLRREQITEIRRIKARVESERLPRGADPLTHTKLGRGGIADVEWTVQLWQLRHGHEVEGLRSTRTLVALRAAHEADLVSVEDAEVLDAAWTLCSRVRNALTLIRGRAVDQLPRHGEELAGVARILAAGDPGEFLDEYLKTTRRARAAVERLFHA